MKNFKELLNSVEDDISVFHRNEEPISENSEYEEILSESLERKTFAEFKKSMPTSCINEEVNAIKEDASHQDAYDYIMRLDKLIKKASKELKNNELGSGSNELFSILSRFNSESFYKHFYK